MSDRQANPNPPEHPAPHEARVSPWVLWTGLGLAPLAFALQVSASYAVASTRCDGPAHARGWLLALSLLAALLAGAGLLAAIRAWRATRAEKQGDAQALADRGEGRTRFMGMFGMTSSALMLAAVLALSVSIGFFGACPGLSAG